MNKEAREKVALVRIHDVMDALQEEGIKFDMDAKRRGTRVFFKNRSDKEMGALLIQEQGMDVSSVGPKALMVSFDTNAERNAMKKVDIARSLVALAKELEAEDEIGEGDELDERFVSKLRTLRGQLSKISQKKRRKLGQLGIGVLRQTATVEDLVDALLVAANS